MGFGAQGHGTSGFGTTGGLVTQIPTLAKVQSTELVAADIIKITFDQSVVVDAQYLNPQNYSVISGDISILQVLAPKNGALVLDYALLKTTQQQSNTEYKIRVSGIKARSGAAMSSLADGEWVYRRTKVDSALSSIPSFYNKDVDSNIRSLLTAISLSDNQIGGEIGTVEILDAPVIAEPTLISDPFLYIQSGGLVEAGETVVLSPGNWTEATSYYYVILVDGVIVSQTNTYVIPSGIAGSLITGEVTAVNALGFAVGYADPIEVITSFPDFPELPGTTWLQLDASEGVVYDGNSDVTSWTPTASSYLNLAVEPVAASPGEITYSDTGFAGAFPGVKNTGAISSYLRSSSIYPNDTAYNIAYTESWVAWIVFDTTQNDLTTNNTVIQLVGSSNSAGNPFKYSRSGLGNFPDADNPAIGASTRHTISLGPNVVSLTLDSTHSHDLGSSVLVVGWDAPNARFCVSTNGHTYTVTPNQSSTPTSNGSLNYANNRFDVFSSGTLLKEDITIAEYCIHNLESNHVVTESLVSDMAGNLLGKYNLLDAYPVEYADPIQSVMPGVIQFHNKADTGIILDGTNTYVRTWESAVPLDDYANRSFSAGTYGGATQVATIQTVNGFPAIYSTDYRDGYKFTFGGSTLHCLPADETHSCLLMFAVIQQTGRGFSGFSKVFGDSGVDYGLVIDNVTGSLYYDGNGVAHTLPASSFTIPEDELVLVGVGFDPTTNEGIYIYNNQIERVAYPGATFEPLRSTNVGLIQPRSSVQCLTYMCEVGCSGMNTDAYQILTDTAVQALADALVDKYNLTVF